MIQHIKLKKMILFIYVTNLLFLLSGCKTETKDALVKENVISTTEITDTLATTNENEKNIDTDNSTDNKSNFELIEVKQISNNKTVDSIVSRLKSIKVNITDNNIIINNIKAKFTVNKSNSKKLFGQNYIYKYYSDYLSKNYKINIQNEVNYIEVSYEDSQKYPFKDFFMEGGVSVFTNDYLILQYSDYLITFRKKSSTNNNSNNLVSLPFDYQKYINDCYLKNNADCDKRYPQIQGNELNLVTSLINNKINKNKPDSIYHINNGGLPFETYIIQIRDDKEDYFLNHLMINVKNNILISKQLIGIQLDGDAPEDLTYTAKTFILNKILNIDIFEMRFSKIYKKIESYKLNSDGILSKI